MDERDTALQSDPGATLSPAQCVVGIGASAGGLESLERFFQGVPLRSGLAFVIVQHLSPDHQSLMGELLARFTALPVKEAQDCDLLAEDHVYVLPPGKELEVEAGRLRLSDRDTKATLNLPIDRFFNSLAAECGQHAVAVVLSGSGTDGSRGIRRVHDAGGYVAVEEPSSARFDGMPRAAIATNVVDAVLPVDELPTVVVSRAHDQAGPADPASQELLGQITNLLRRPFGIDFTSYKSATVLRRITRRQRMHGLGELAEYVRMLANDDDEVLALGHDLLIGVTSFFRDPASWEIMQREVIPNLVKRATPERGLRCWVAGCASGEEAYTLAMLLLEAAPKGMPVRVFATDVHRGSLTTASRGVYKADALGPLSDERMARFFTPLPDGKVQVAEALRSAVVFAAHNVLRDAPFTQLDLITCRNVLIYFRPRTQVQALMNLQFGLRQGGVIMLGPSETLGGISSDYAPIDETHRIYRRTQVSKRIPALATQRRVPHSQPPLDHQRAGRLDIYKALLTHAMPPSFLVRPDRTVIECFGGSERFLKVPAQGVAMMNLIDLAPDSAAEALDTVIAVVLQRKEAVSTPSIPWDISTDVDQVTLSVTPIATEADELALLIAIVSHQADSHIQQPPRVSLADLRTARVTALEEELSTTKGHLQSAVEDLEASSEEMQATNEELFASNEELQSTNEELHSVNEELHTVNAELQIKLRELADLNRDMQQLFENVDVAILFLDEALRIRRFTPTAAERFGLLEHDVGRPLDNLKLPLERPTLMEELRTCLESQDRQTYEARDSAGNAYVVHMHATKREDGELSVVLAATDVTSLQEARKRVRVLSAAADSSADAIIILDLQRRVIEWNSAAEKLYGIGRADILGKPLDAIIPEELRPEFDQALTEVANGSSEATLETRRIHRSGKTLDVGTTVSPVFDDQDHLIGYSKFDRDISEQRAREAALREREQRLTDAFNNSPDMLASVDLTSGRLVDFNDTLSNRLGYSPEELQNFHFSQLYTAESQEDSRKAAERLRRTGELRDTELVMRKRDGSSLPVSLNSTAVRDVAGNVVRSRTVIRDITMRKRAEEAMTEAVRMREYFLATASHELRTPMHAIRSASQLIADPSTSNAEHEQAVAVLQRQTAHVTELLDALLDVARMTQNRLDLSPKSVDLRSPIEDAIDAMRYAFQEKGVELEVSGLDSKLPAKADAARIQQAVSNLLGNALRHTEAGSAVYVSIQAEGKRAILEVRDEGDGIAADRLEAIFEAFASGSNRDRMHRGALGLGLSLARRIALGHGGTLMASSPGVGLGATFRLELPLRAQASKAPQSTRPRKAEREGARIVLIEDQEDSREMLAMLLKRRGDQVFKAENGTQGVALILEQRPDLALVDIGLPDMDGYEVAAQVFGNGGDEIPLVALTGYGQREDVLKSEEAGFRMHLTKPISMQALDQAICEILPPEGE